MNWNINKTMKYANLRARLYICFDGTRSKVREQLNETRKSNENSRVSLCLNPENTFKDLHDFLFQPTEARVLLSQTIDISLLAHNKESLTRDT